MKTKNIRSATPRGFAQAVFEKYGASDIKFTKEGDAAYDEWSKAYDEFRVIKPRSKQ